MRYAAVCLAIVVGMAGWSPAREPNKVNLAVLYVGRPSTPRGKAYQEFLRRHFQWVKATEWPGFVPEQANSFDAVLLDWSQEERPPKPMSPLGPRQAWNKPTVLLGSAGLLLAEAWDSHGAIG